MYDPRGKLPSGIGNSTFGTLDCERHPDVVTHLLEALALGQAAICMCDERDFIRYANPAFRAAFFPDLEAGVAARFVDALAGAIRSGKGIKLESMLVEEFIPRVTDRRRSGPPRYDFTVDLADGSWWCVNDRRLDNGWTLVVAVEISSIKKEEFRLRTAHAEAVRAARTDYLTGLANRRCGMEMAEAALADAHGTGLPLALAIVDLDHFKRINDLYGHDTGDAVLRHFAMRMSAELGPLDHLSRIGGEEFMIVMPGTPASVAEQRLQRLAHQLGPLERGPGKRPIGYAFSAGVACAGSSEELRSVLSRADSALYSAKVGGRGRIVIGDQLTSSAA